MPPRQTQGSNVVQRFEDELHIRIRNLRQEFDAVANNARESSNLENASEEIKGLYNIMEARFEILRNRYYNEADMIVTDLKKQVQKAMQEQGRRGRVRGNAERFVTASLADTGTREPERENEDVGIVDAGNIDAPQDSGQTGQTSSEVTGPTNGKRKTKGRTAHGTKGRKNLNAAGSATVPVPSTHPISALASGMRTVTFSDADIALDSGAGPSTATASASAPGSGAGPSTATASASAPGSGAGPSSASATAPAPDSAEPAAHPAIGGAAGSDAGSNVPSAAGSVELPVKRKSKRRNREGTPVLQEAETAASQPETPIKTIRTGSTKIILKGPTPPRTRATHASTVQNQGKRKKTRKESKKTKGKTPAPAVAEIEPNEVNNNNEDDTTRRMGKKSPDSTEPAAHPATGGAASSDVGSNVPSAAGSVELPVKRKSKRRNREGTPVLQEAETAASQPETPIKTIRTGSTKIILKGPTPPRTRATHASTVQNQGKRKKTRKESKKTKCKTTVPAVVEIEPNEVNNNNEDDTTRRKGKKSTRTKQKKQNTNTNSEEETEVHPVEPTARPGSTRRKKTAPTQEEAAPTQEVAAPTPEEAAPTPEEPSTNNTEQAAPEVPLRRSKRIRKPTRKLLEGG